MDTLANRESCYWWVALAGRVTYELGYSCRPNQPKGWWFPEREDNLGQTLTEDVHLFRTFEAARTVAAAWIESEYERLGVLLWKLQRSGICCDVCYRVNNSQQFEDWRYIGSYYVCADCQQRIRDEPKDAARSVLSIKGLYATGPRPTFAT